MADSALKGLVALQTQDAALKATVQTAIQGVQALQSQVASLQALNTEDDQVASIATDMQSSISLLASAFVQAATTGVSATVTDPQTSTAADTVAGTPVAQTPVTPVQAQQDFAQHDEDVKADNKKK